MSKGRKAFGPKKKQYCDLHKCKKSKKAETKQSQKESKHRFSWPENI